MCVGSRLAFDIEVLMLMERCTDPGLSVLVTLIMAQEFYGFAQGLGHKATTTFKSISVGTYS